MIQFPSLAHFTIIRNYFTMYMYNSFNISSCTVNKLNIIIDIITYIVKLKLSFYQRLAYPNLSGIFNCLHFTYVYNAHILFIHLFFLIYFALGCVNQRYYFFISLYI